MRTDGQTVTTKLIANFRDFAKDPKNCTLFRYGKPHCNILTHVCYLFSATSFLGFNLYMAYTAGHAVAQTVEARRYKPEGRGFDFRWRHWNFSLT